MEKRAIIAPGITPPEQPVPTPKTAAAQPSVSSEQQLDQLADHLTKRAAEAVRDRLQ